MDLTADKICRTCMMTTKSTNLCSIFEDNPLDVESIGSTTILDKLINFMDLNVNFRSFPLLWSGFCNIFFSLTD
jgi:hypothetical protein